MNIEVSVIIPTFNRIHDLKQCLEALTLQKTNRTWEIIVVDDASTENLNSVREAFGNRLELNWIRMEKNGGPARARNAGLSVARGEIIVFTDDDCRPEPDWLEAMVKPFEDDRVSGVKGVYKTEQTDLWARLAQLEFEERYELLKSCKNMDFVDTYSGAFRKRDLLTIGGFDESFPRPEHEDVDLAFRIKKLGGKFVFSTDAVVKHRHREGLMSYFRLKINRGRGRMRVYRLHPNKVGRESYTPRSMKLQLALLGLFPILLFCRRGRKLLLSTWPILWLMSCFPLLRLAPRDLLPWVPIFAFVRGVALILGMFFGFIELLLEKTKIYRFNLPVKSFMNS